VLECVVSESGQSCGMNVTMSRWNPSEKNEYSQVDVNVIQSNSWSSQVTVDRQSLTYTPDNWNQPQLLVFSSVDDDVAEPTQTFSISMVATIEYLKRGTSCTTATCTKSTLGQDVAILNYDNDEAGIKVIPTGGWDPSLGRGVTDEAGKLRSNFTVELNSQPELGSVVTIDIKSDNDREGLPSPSYLQFDSYTWDQPRLVMMVGVDDDIDDGDITYKAVAASRSGDPLYHGLTNETSFVNTNDDTLGINWRIVSPLNYTTEWDMDPLSGRTAKGEEFTRINVYLNSQPTAPVLFSVASTNMDEAVSDSSLFVVAGDNWREGQVITLTGSPDSKDEFEVAGTYSVVIVPMITQDEGYTDVTALYVPFQNLDDPTNRISISVVSSLLETPLHCITAENGSTTVLAVHNLYWDFVDQPFTKITVNFISNDTTEAMLLVSEGVLRSSTSVTFSPETWNETMYVTVQGIDDALVDKEFENHYKISMSGVIEYTSEASPKVILDTKYTREILGVNIDDDVPGFLVVEGADAVQCVTYESASSTIECDYGFTLASEPQNDVHFNLTISKSEADLDEGELVATVTRNHADGNYDDTVTIVVMSDQLDHNGKLVSQMAQYVIEKAYWHHTHVFHVKGSDDQQNDGEQRYQLTVGPASSEDAAYNKGWSRTFDLINMDDDVATIDIMQNGEFIVGEDGSALMFSDDVDETGKAQTFVLTLPIASDSSKPTSDIAVSIYSTFPQEVAISPANVVFTNADGFKSEHVISMTGLDDMVTDGHKTGTVMVNVTAADPRYNFVKMFQIRNLDDDLMQTDVTNCTISENMTYVCDVEVYFTEFVDSMKGATVNIDNPASLKAAVSTSQLVVDAASPTTPVRFTVTAIDNKVDDDDMMFALGISASVSYQHTATSAVQSKGIMPRSVDVTCFDDDVAGIVVEMRTRPAVNASFMPDTSITTENGSIVIVPGAAYYKEVPMDMVVTYENQSLKALAADWHFKVRLQSRPLHKVEIPITVSDENEGTESTITCPLTDQYGADALFFDAEMERNWFDYCLVTMQGLDDFVYDYDKPYTIRAGPAKSEDPKYNGRWGDNAVPALNIDNDAIGIDFTVSVNDDGDLLDHTSEDGVKSASAVMMLGSQPKKTVLFVLSASRPSEATVSPSIVAFSPESWDIPQFIVVQGQDDAYKDGTQLYEVIADTLFTQDEDYQLAKLSKRLTFYNEDDPHDRSQTECPVGQYGEAGSADNQCTGCPVGRFGTTTVGTLLMEDTCQKCWPGTFRDTTGGRFGLDQKLRESAHPCAVCPDGKFNSLWGQYECEPCDGINDARTDAPLCKLGAMAPWKSGENGGDLSGYSTVAIHGWNVLEEDEYSGVWDVGVTIEVTEEMLQFFLMIGCLVWMMAFCACCQCINCFAKAQMIPEHHWSTAKAQLVNSDSFADQHMRYIGGTEGKNTLAGGFATVFFFVLSWSLVGIVFYMYVAYNDKVTQSLVPTTEVNATGVLFDFEATFFGYNGPAFETAAEVENAITVTGVTCTLKSEDPETLEVTTVERTPGEKMITASNLKTCGAGCAGAAQLTVRWKCLAPVVTSPSVMFDLNSAAQEYQVSASAISWFMRATEVIPLEDNTVASTFVPIDIMGEKSVFRGPSQTQLGIKIIPATYDNIIDMQHLEGFRLQYDYSNIGSQQTAATHMEMMNDVIHQNTLMSNAVRLQLVLSSSSVQLDTMIEPKETLLEVWGVAGGLFASIGATVVVGMQFFEYLLKALGIAKKRKKPGEGEDGVGKKKKGQDASETSRLGLRGPGDKGEQRRRKSTAVGGGQRAPVGPHGNTRSDDKSDIRKLDRRVSRNIIEALNPRTARRTSTQSHDAHKVRQPSRRSSRNLVISQFSAPLSEVLSTQAQRRQSHMLPGGLAGATAPPAASGGRAGAGGRKASMMAPVKLSDDSFVTSFGI
jgi:hypothetical protein